MKSNSDAFQQGWGLLAMKPFNRIYWQAQKPLSPEGFPLWQSIPSQGLYVVSFHTMNHHILTLWSVYPQLERQGLYVISRLYPHGALHHPHTKGHSLKPTRRMLMMAIWREAGLFLKYVWYWVGALCSLKKREGKKYSQAIKSSLCCLWAGTLKADFSETFGFYYDCQHLVSSSKIILESKFHLRSFKYPSVPEVEAGRQLEVEGQP